LVFSFPLIFLNEDDHLYISIKTTVLAQWTPIFFESTNIAFVTSVTSQVFLKQQRNFEHIAKRLTKKSISLLGKGLFIQAKSQQESILLLVEPLHQAQGLSGCDDCDGGIDYSSASPG
jgi:hypothetical protein